MVAVWVVALAAIVSCGIDIWLKVATAAAACIYAFHAARRFVQSPARRCAWHESGHWRVRDSLGDEHVATLLHSAARGPLIVVVLLAGPLRRIPLVLLPDNCDADVRRRLRVRLSQAPLAEN